MKRPLAYITAAWSGDPCEATEQAAKYCRAVYEAGFFAHLPHALSAPFPERRRSRGAQERHRHGP